MRPFERPTVEQFQGLRTWLLAQGMTGLQLASSIGNAPQQRAIGTIADSLRQRLKTLPKRPAQATLKRG